METTTERRLKLYERLKNNRYEAHQVIFEKRHKNNPAPYQEELINLLYDKHSLVVVMAFRGAAKSTFIEEYVLLSALFGDIKFGLLVGPKWESACDRLVSIRNELENNDTIIELFGDHKSDPWSLGELVLKNGVKLQAVGAGQSMRGKKFNAERPDLAIIDDLEDDDSVRTEEAIHRTDRWLAGTLRPALQPDVGRIRFLGTPLHPKSLIFTKCNDQNWKAKKFPVINIDTETGEEKSAWPSRFPLQYLQDLRSEYIRSGNMLEWQQEYMCVSEDVAAKPFQRSMIKVEPVVQSYLPKYMFVDPARTVKAKSARTGYVCWSWMGNRLIVHDAQGHFHKPDEIIKTILDWDDLHKPVRVGIELVGLEEWLGQPLRMACSEQGRSVPWEDIRAPRDKISFIKGLQPAYNAGEVIHAKSLPDLDAELESFPAGRMDVLNALAYSLRMRDGRPVYDDFTARHIASVLEPKRYSPFYLCVSSRSAMTTGVLLQLIDGCINIYRDWVFNQPPGECMETLLQEASMESGGKLKILAPTNEFDQWNNTGLPAAFRSFGQVATRTSPVKNCEGALRPWLQEQKHGKPKLLVSVNCRWVIGALAGGYTRFFDKHGQLNPSPSEGQYRVIAESLESFVAWLKAASVIEEEDGWNYRNEGGRKIISLLPDRR